MNTKRPSKLLVCTIASLAAVSATAYAQDRGRGIVGMPFDGGGDFEDPIAAQFRSGRPGSEFGREADPGDDRCRR